MTRRRRRITCLGEADAAVHSNPTVPTHHRMRPDQPASQETRIRLPRQDTTWMSKALAPHVYTALAPRDYTALAPHDFKAPAPHVYTALAPQDIMSLAPLDSAPPRGFTSGRAPNAENLDVNLRAANQYQLGQKPNSAEPAQAATQANRPSQSDAPTRAGRTRKPASHGTFHGNLVDKVKLRTRIPATTFWNKFLC